MSFSLPPPAVSVTLPTNDPRKRLRTDADPDEGRAVNAVVRNLSKLEGRNYVRKADPAKKNYWHDWSFGPLEQRREASGDEWR